MNRRLYEIQLKSLRSAVEHLQTLHLDELAACAGEHGTEADRALIQRVKACLTGLASADSRG